MSQYVDCTGCGISLGGAFPRPTKCNACEGYDQGYAAAEKRLGGVHRWAPTQGMTGKHCTTCGIRDTDDHDGYKCVDWLIRRAQEAEDDVKRMVAATDRNAEDAKKWRHIARMAEAPNRYFHAQKIVGPRPVEMAEWAHEAKIELLAKEFSAMFRAGVASVKYVGEGTMASNEVCPYCNVAGQISRERSPEGHTKCEHCGAVRKHADWGKPLAAPSAPVVSIAPDRASETADFRDDFAVALGDKLHPDVYGRLEALNELYGEVGFRAVLSMLITESYMDRVAAFRDAEEG